MLRGGSRVGSRSSVTDALLVHGKWACWTTDLSPLRICNGRLAGVRRWLAFWRSRGTNCEMVIVCSGSEVIGPCGELCLREGDMQRDFSGLCTRPRRARRGMACFSAEDACAKGVGRFMEVAYYRQCLEQISLGKRLPTVVYVYREEGGHFGSPLDLQIGGDGEEVRHRGGVPCGQIQDG